MWETLLFYVLQFFRQYPTKILLAETLFCIGAPKRSKFWYKLIPATLILCALPYLLGYSFEWLTIGGWFNYSFLLYFILSIGLVGLCFKFSWQQLLFYCSAAYVIEHFCDSLQRIIRPLLAENIEGFTSLYSNLTYLGIMLVIYSLSYFIFVRQLKKLENEAIKSVFVICVSIFTVLLVNVLSVFMGHIGKDTYHKVYDCIACLMLMVIQYSLSYRFTLVKKNEVLKLMLYKYEEQHRLSKESIDMINVKCHDLKQQIRNIRKLINIKDVKESLKEVEDSVIIFDSVIKTENPVLDIVLTEKKLFCEQYGIRFSCIVDGARLEFMEEEDIYALFGNALDNAIENVMSLEDVSSRIISMSVTKKEKILVIHFDNYCDREIDFKNGLPVTTKEDRSVHGFGMQSMRYVVKKYGGTMSVYVKNNTFNVNVLIPLNYDS